jgi:hypothetical protein
MFYVCSAPAHSDESPTIQVWKSTTNWFAKSPRERRAIFDQLKKAMGTHCKGLVRAEGEPFLIQNGTDSLLIWTSNSDSASLTVSDLKELNHYFEPLATVTPRKNQSAKSLALKLSNTQFHLLNQTTLTRL